MYNNQTVFIQVYGKQEEAKIKKGVWQGCMRSPMLFNLSIKEAMKDTRMELQKGVRIEGVTVSILPFANDISFCAEKEEDLQCILIVIKRILKNKHGIQLNKIKTKIMVCIKNEPVRYKISVDNEQIQQVKYIVHSTYQ